MSLKVWMDGSFVDKDDARISVYDHGLLYGDGVFEGMRTYSGRVFECEAHVLRLFESAAAIRLEIPATVQELCEAVVETVRINHFKDCYIRLVVTRGVGYLGLSPSKCPRPSIFIIADTIDMYPVEVYEKGMAIITSSVVRNHPNAVNPRIKSLNYLNNILAKIEANDAGVPEAIMLNQVGNVAECTGDNIFIVRRGQVITPPASDGILEGITRATIIKLCDKLGIPLLEASIQRHDLYIADECFLTGSAAEVVPVTMIDKRPIGAGGPGPITRRLMQAFHQLVRQA